MLRLRFEVARRGERPGQAQSDNAVAIGAAAGVLALSTAFIILSTPLSTLSTPLSTLSTPLSALSTPLSTLSAPLSTILSQSVITAKARANGTSYQAS